MAESKKFKTSVPTVKEMFAAGTHFGHETKRWNPNMEEFIFDAKKSIHILDLTKTQEQLAKAADFLADASARGNVLFVGTKRQAADIVRQAAIESGSLFVDQRWAGGLLTNFNEVKKSLNRLRKLEEDFEKGIKGRTKFEISVLKKEWAKLSRLYSGVKEMKSKPTAVVVVDAKYEKSAVREAKRLGIPVVAIVDTNTNPKNVDYVIPANDDAITSIKLLVNFFGDVVKETGHASFIKHNLTDYSSYEVEIKKTDDEVEDDEKGVETEEPIVDGKKAKKVVKVKAKAKAPRGKKDKGGTKGILERVQEAKKKK